MTANYAKHPARLAAIAAGETTWIGPPCMHHGPGAQRYTKDGTCKHCRLDQHRRARESDPVLLARRQEKAAWNEECRLDAIACAERAQAAKDKAAAVKAERNAKKQLALVAKHADEDDENQQAKRLVKINRKFIELLTFEKIRSLRENA
jgi:hypothetical protein